MTIIKKAEYSIFESPCVVNIVDNRGKKHRIKVYIRDGGPQFARSWSYQLVYEKEIRFLIFSKFVEICASEKVEGYHQNAFFELNSDNKNIDLIKQISDILVENKILNKIEITIYSKKELWYCKICGGIKCPAILESTEQKII